MGQGSYYNLVEEMRVLACKHLSFLWLKGRRVRSHLDPLVTDLGVVDCSSLSYWGSPLRISDFLTIYNPFLARKNHKALWRAPPLFLFWVICKERNIIIFDNASYTARRINLALICSLFY